MRRKLIKTYGMSRKTKNKYDRRNNKQAKRIFIYGQVYKEVNNFDI